MADGLSFSAILSFAIKGASAVNADTRAMVSNINELYKAGELTDSEFNRLSKSAIKTGQAMSTAGNNSKRSATGFIATQIALQTVGQAATQAGKELIKLGAAPFAVAAQFQDDFAQVARTSGLTGKALGDLRAQLVNLSTTTPVDFKDVTGIASLGGQLGISGPAIATFTKTIIELQTASDLTGEAAGTAIARIATLTNLGSDGYQRLGSAIALAGVKSIATESQIVKTANTFASVGQQAGFTAPQIIGFSTALASLAIPPELARGTFQQFFSKLQGAVEGGGSMLQTFAQTSHLTEAQLVKTYNSGGSASIVTKFFQGLNKEGTGATATLASLGITSVRYVPTLEKLAQNVDVLSKSFKTANVGFDANTELQRQYGIVFETTSQKIKELKNGFTAFLASIGSGSLPGLSTLVDGLTGIVKALNGLPDGAKAALTVVAALTAVAGAGLLVVGKFAQAAASVLALKAAFTGVSGSAGKATLAIDAEALAADGATISNTAAGVSAKDLESGFKFAGTGLLDKVGQGLGAIAVTGTSAAAATTGLGIAAGALAVAIPAVIGFGFLAYLQSVEDKANVAAAGVGNLSKAVAGNQSTGKITSAANLDIKGIATAKNVTATTSGGVQSRFQSPTQQTQSNPLFQGATKDIKDTDTALAKLVANGYINTAHQDLDSLATAGVNISKQFPKAQKAIEEYENGELLANGTNKQFIASTGTIVTSSKDFSKTLAALVKSYDQYATAAGQSQDATFNFGSAVLAAKGDVTQIQAANKDAATSALDLSKANADGSHNLNAFTSAGQTAHSALEAIAVAGNKATGQLIANGASARDISASYQGTVGQVRALGAQFGLSGQALNNFVADYVASPKTLGYRVSVDGIPGAESALGYLARPRVVNFTAQVNAGNLPASTANKLNSLQQGGVGGFADGGYTGPGGKYQPAGIVHRGEYVVPKSEVNQVTGLPNLDALGRLARGQSGRSGYAGGGFVDSGMGVVELGPKSLQRLAGQAASIILDSGALAGAVNSTNARYANRGGRR